MRDQSYVEPLESHALFEDGMGSRPEVKGTVSREEGLYSEVVLTGRREGVLAERIPISLSRSVLERGQERFQIFCVPCHGMTGRGDGLVTQHGFPNPPPFASERLREISDGHLFEVISNGYGVMYSYGSRIEPTDRWAIVAYVRALQRAESLAEAKKEGGQ